MSEASQGFLYNFGAKYWNVVDQDGSGSLSYDEYKYTMAAFAATDAQVILKGFDSNTDGILSGSELSSFRSFVSGALASNNWNPSASDVGAIKAAWANAQGKKLQYFVTYGQFSKPHKLAQYFYKFLK